MAVKPANLTAEVAANTALTAQATTTARGTVELATAAEVTTGTDTGRALTPDALANSTPVFNGSGLTNLPTGALSGPVIGTRWSAAGILLGLSWGQHDLTDVADLEASPGDGVWGNSDNLTTGTISGSALSIAGDAGETLRWGSGAFNEAPWYYWLLPRGPHGAAMVAFQAHVQTDDTLASPGAGTFQFAGIVFTEDDDTPDDGTWQRVVIGNYSTEGLVVRTDDFNSANPGNQVALTSATQGCWVRCILLPSGKPRWQVYDAPHTSEPDESDWVNLAFENSTLPDAGLTSDVAACRIVLHTYDAGVLNGIQWNWRHIKVGFVGEVTVA